MEGSANALAGVVVCGGFALAFVFGAVANWTNFCTMGALSDIVNMGHWGRMTMWLLAIVVAMIGARPWPTPDRLICPRPRCSVLSCPGCRC